MANKQNVKFSIVVPVYKVEEELPRCVESLLNQTYQCIEIVLVDDGSPDRCSELCDGYAKQDVRVKVLHKQNGGLSDARNAGIKEATGDYVLLVDSDDAIELNTCERFYETIQKDWPDIVVGEAKQWKKDGIEFLDHTNLQPNTVYEAREYVKLAISEKHWWAPACLNLYKRTFLLKNDLKFQTGLLHEDMLFLPYVFLKNAKVKYLKGYFYNYIIRENSITQKQKTSKNAEHLFWIYEEWAKLFQQETDKELYRKLQGFLMKCYLNTCREYQLPRKDKKIVSVKRALEFSLDAKERIKALIFSVAPSVYIKL